MMESLPKPNTKSYTLKASGPQILFFHGYTGSPYDLITLANSLHASGYHVRVPKLKGHGQSNSDKLNAISYKEWINQAKKEFLQLDQHRPIILGGLSMGALIASVIYLQFPQTKGLILLSPALKLTLSGLILTDLALLIPAKMKIPKWRGESDIAWKHGRKMCPSYPDIPLLGLKELNKLSVQVNGMLNDITCPTFVAFGSKDATIDIDFARKTLTKLKAPLLEIKEYENSSHILPLDFDFLSLCRDVKNFLSSLPRM